MSSSAPPPSQAPGKKEAVQEMFDEIAPRYDLLNRVLSGGVDQSWRRKAIKMLPDQPYQRILDVATGTADLAIEAVTLEPIEVVGIDIAENMLELGREKVDERNLAEIVRLESGDAANIDYPDDYFDSAMVAFGVRNFEDLRAGLKEIRRVLKPNAPLVVLEFSQPRHFPIKQAYMLYSKYILPKIGKSISKNEEAYKYLPDSIKVFPSGSAFLEELAAVGFEKTDQKSLTFGIASIYVGR